MLWCQTSLQSQFSMWNALATVVKPEQKSLTSCCLLSWKKKRNMGFSLLAFRAWFSKWCLVRKWQEWNPLLFFSVALLKLKSLNLCSDHSGASFCQCSNRKVFIFAIEFALLCIFPKMSVFWKWFLHPAMSSWHWHQMRHCKKKVGTHCASLQWNNC